MSEDKNRIPTSLVKYTTPVEVDENEEKTTKISNIYKDSGQLCEDNETMEEFLNYVIPVIEWRSDGKLWRQKVATDPPSRFDVLNLQEELDKRLVLRQAKGKGICPIRRQLYDQCLDELIRQMTIQCPDRGLMMVRVRDELRMTLHSHEMLYNNSVIFGIKKAAANDKERQEYEETIRNLQEDLVTTKRHLENLTMINDQVERRNNELIDTERRMYMEQIQRLQDTVKMLNAQAEGFVSQRKSYDDLPEK